MRTPNPWCGQRALVEDLKIDQPQASTLPADPQRSWRAKRVLGSCPSEANDPPRRPRARVKMSLTVVCGMGSALEKTRKNHTREEMRARMYARSGSQDDGPGVHNFAIAIGKPLLSCSLSLFRRNLGIVTAFRAKRD